MSPAFAVLQIENPHWNCPRLWLPLFLLWIPAFFLVPFVLFVILIACAATEINPWNAISTFWGILTGLSGTDVRVEANGNKVLVRIL
jgi:hypothetical protein